MAYSVLSSSHLSGATTRYLKIQDHRRVVRYNKAREVQRFRVDAGMVDVHEVYAYSGLMFLDPMPPAYREFHTHIATHLTRDNSPALIIVGLSNDLFKIICDDLGNLLPLVPQGLDKWNELNGFQKANYSGRPKLLKSSPYKRMKSRVRTYIAHLRDLLKLCAFQTVVHCSVLERRYDDRCADHVDLLTAVVNQLLTLGLRDASFTNRNNLPIATTFVNVAGLYYDGGESVFAVHEVRGDRARRRRDRRIRHLIHRNPACYHLIMRQLISSV